MTECKHCGKEIVRYSNQDDDWYVIGDDDPWVHAEPTKHLAIPKTK